MIMSGEFKIVTFRHLERSNRNYRYTLSVYANNNPEEYDAMHTFKNVDYESHFKHEDGEYFEIKNSDYKEDPSQINIVYSYAKEKEGVYDLILYEYYPGRPQAVRFDVRETDGQLEIIESSMDLVFHLP